MPSLRKACNKKSMEKKILKTFSVWNMENPLNIHPVWTRHSVVSQYFSFKSKGIFRCSVRGAVLDMWKNCTPSTPELGSEQRQFIVKAMSEHTLKLVTWMKKIRTGSHIEVFSHRRWVQKTHQNACGRNTCVLENVYVFIINSDLEHLG